MITHCQECDTYFRVSVEQLKASQGNVKCGCCMTVFNAIESLLESSDAAAHQATPATTNQTANKTSGSVGSALLGPEETEEPVNFDKEPDVSSWDDVDFKTDETVDSIDAEFTAVEDSFDEEILESGEFDQVSFDESINDEVQEPQKRSGGIWVFASLLMIGMLAFQFINFNPATMLAKFPQLQPMCRFIDCPIEKELVHDTSKINLISRDVREHPQFKDVLLVNATLMNRADDHLPFPKLQLDLFDKVGRPIGSRQFTPDEYLDSSVDLDVGMKPKLPVHIVLEVMGTGKETNSFEFKFL